MSTMRAKMRVEHTSEHHPTGRSEEISQVDVAFRAVGPNESYPEDGSDENNNFARWTPAAEAKFTIQNPALFEAFKPGDEFYVDFTRV